MNIENTNYLNKNLHEKTALVVGGSIAGLLAARVLSSYYESVVIVEKDDLPEEPSNRSGTPQAFHIHRVLPRGNMILERFFPGYIDDLLAQGAYPTKNEKMTLVNQYGQVDISSPEKNASCSRALLEWVLRQRLNKIKNVRFLPKQQVIGLKIDREKNRVTGISIQERNRLKKEQILRGDMIVDASGRSSKLSQWLESFGYHLPNPERIEVSLGYSTRYYKVPPHVAKKWGSIVTEAQPSKGISAGMFLHMENNIAGTLLFSAGGEHYPSTNPTEYEKEFNRLANPMIAEVLKEIEPITNPRGYRAPQSTRQRFEEMKEWPSGLLVLGDALCNFDPIYGQGMTVAAIEAEILETCLHEQQKSSIPNFERCVLQRMQEAIEPAWWLSTVADLRWKGVQYIGSYSLKGITFAQDYFDLYLKQAMNQKNEDKSRMMFQQYSMMNGLVVSPREIINSSIMENFLIAEELSENIALFKELYGENSLKFDEIIPTFTETFNDRKVTTDSDVTKAKQ